MSHAENESVREATFRNYRPEYEPDHPRKHTVFHPDPQAFVLIEQKMAFTEARHRLAFLAAAATVNGLFLDLLQTPDKIPLPDIAQRWCAILNDDEPRRGGSRGPGFFDTSSLIRLVQMAQAIVLNSSGPDGVTYVTASLPLARMGHNCLLVETTPAHLSPWRAFLTYHRRNAPMAIVTGSIPKPLPGLGRTLQ